jgi:cytochrome b pre-mRNA-processing protein 3
MIWRLFRPRPRDRSIDELYGAIVAQARAAGFYLHYGVPDSLEGRFDLIVLHLVLMIERLGAAENAIGQELFDAFCRDLDANLREMGVGDLTVPKRMRKFGEAFYGRQAAYLAAFAAPGQEALEKALARNIFAGEDAGRNAQRLADYVRAARQALKSQDDGALGQGDVRFPDPARLAEAQAQV